MAEPSEPAPRWLLPVVVEPIPFSVFRSNAFRRKNGLLLLLLLVGVPHNACEKHEHQHAPHWHIRDIFIWTKRTTVKKSVVVGSAEVSFASERRFGMTMVAAPALCREPLLQAWPQPHLFLQLFRKSSSPHSTEEAALYRSVATTIVL